MLEAETLRLLASLQIDEAVSEWILAELEKLYDRGTDEAALKRLVSRRKALQGLQAKAYEEKLLGKRKPTFSPQRESLSNSCKPRRRYTLRRTPPRRRNS